MISTPRVLFITGEYPPDAGGVGDYTALLRSALDELGAASTVVTRGIGIEPGVESVKSWGPQSLRSITRIAREHSANILHIQYQAGAFQMRPTVNAMPTLLGRRLHVPVVTTFHDLRSPYLFPKAGALRDFAVTSMARGSTRSIVTNPADERALREECVRAVPIPIGSNVARYPDPSLFDIRAVAFFGHNSHGKGLEHLIDAVGRIPADRRPRVRWIGSPGTPSRSNDVESADHLDAFSDSRGVCVQRTGRLDAREVGRELARAGAIVLPFLEGASLRSGSLLAALDCGRPVVTTAPDHPDDLVSLGTMRQLLFVPRRQPELLTEAIASALRDAPAGDPLPPEFSWKSIAARHMDLYRQLLAGAPR